MSLRKFREKRPIEFEFVLLTYFVADESLKIKQIFVWLRRRCVYITAALGKLSRGRIDLPTYC